MNRINLDEIFIRCGCGTEGILFERLDNYEEMNVSFYRFGYAPYQSGLKDKLKQIWKIITTGVPYSDQVTIDYCKLDRLIEFLNNIKDGERC